MIDKTKRLSMVEAYSLIVIGNENLNNTFEEAKKYLGTIFKVEDLEKGLAINPKLGEAEITLETVYLWNSLQEN